jgi:hypothetical protein
MTDYSSSEKSSINIVVDIAGIADAAYGRDGTQSAMP